jgi:hypothetical protein
VAAAEAVSASAALLVEEVSRAMLMKRLNVIAASMMAGALVTGAVVRAQQGSENRRLAAKPAEAVLPPIQRYQLSAWSRPAAISDTSSFIAPTHGAYIIDTQSGKAWAIREDGEPKPLGSVK